MKRSWWAALTAVAGILLVLGGCGGGSSGVLTTFNATPAILNLYPSNITAGSATFTLSIAGTGLMSNSQGVTFAYWNGSPRSTTLNLVTNQLQVAITAADVASPGPVQVTVWNPPPGGGASVAVAFTIEPVIGGNPTITSLSPTSAKAGGAAFTLTATGTNFDVNDILTWNGSLLSPTKISGNQASATVPQNDIAYAGASSVAVSKPDLVNASPSVSFPITGPNNPVPTLTALSPSSVTASDLTDIEVTASGSNFVASSVAEWNGTPLATAFVNGSKLVILVPAADISSAGTAQITVTTPAPGGGTSSGVTFTVKSS